MLGFRRRTRHLGSPVCRPRSRSVLHSLSARGRGGHEDAERVTGGIGVDPQRLLLVLGTVVQQPRTELQRVVVGEREVRRAVDGHVQVELLRDTGLRPGRGREIGDLLERELSPRQPAQDQPVAAVRIGITGRWWLVAGAIVHPEQLPVELGETADVGRVEDDLSDREGLWAGHLPTLAAGRPPYPLPPMRERTGVLITRNLIINVSCVGKAAVTSILYHYDSLYSMALTIKNAEAERLTRELAGLAGETITSAITVAVHDRLIRLHAAPDEPGARATRILDLGRKIAAALPPGGLEPDDLYDESGRPK